MTPSSTHRTPEDEHVIHRAKLRLMNRHGWTEDQAYASLRWSAMNQQLTIVAVSRQVLEKVPVYRPARRVLQGVPPRRGRARR